jgi:hypothetical protein
MLQLIARDAAVLGAIAKSRTPGNSSCTLRIVERIQARAKPVVASDGYLVCQFHLSQARRPAGTSAERWRSQTPERETH